MAYTPTSKSVKFGESMVSVYIHHDGSVILGIDRPGLTINTHAKLEDLEQIKTVIDDAKKEAIDGE